MITEVAKNIYIVSANGSARNDLRERDWRFNEFDVVEPIWSVIAKRAKTGGDKLPSFRRNSSSNSTR